MPSPSLAIPQFVKAKTEEELMRAIAKVQVRDMGKIGIITIVWKEKPGEWVCWYRSVKDSHLGTVGNT